MPVVTERFETELGQQAQVGWAACGRIWYGGRLRSLSSFSMTLGYSRRQYLAFTVSEDMETFERCHIDGFHYFCGVPSEILYDNLKTAADHHGPDGQVGECRTGRCGSSRRRAVCSKIETTGLPLSRRPLAAPVISPFQGSPRARLRVGARPNNDAST